MSTKQPRASTDAAELVSARDQENDMRPVEIMARAILDAPLYEKGKVTDELAEAKAAVQALEDAGFAIVSVEPTEEQLIAARDWSVEKYGRGVGDDGATGCYKAMLKAAKATPDR